MYKKVLAAPTVAASVIGGLAIQRHALRIG